MASTTSALVSPVTITKAFTTRTVQRKPQKVVYINGLNAYGGLKAQNSVVSMGLPVNADQGFARLVTSMRVSSSGGRGGALSSTCGVAGEIFQIAAIMNGLVLVGVAVGFVLLRVEAWVEESEA
ncbi:hypothetical protein ACFE04_007118 [Oxalis oulophora]